MALSQELKELYASAGNGVILHTLAFSHPSFTETIYIVRDYNDMTALLEDGAEVLFLRYAFTVTPPGKDSFGNQTLNIAIDSVSRTVIDNLELAMSNPTVPIKVTYRIYIDTDLTGPQNDPPLELFLSAVKVTNYQIVGTAESPNVVGRAFPNINYSPTLFKGLTYAGK